MVERRRYQMALAYPRPSPGSSEEDMKNWREEKMLRLKPGDKGHGFWDMAKQAFHAEIMLAVRSYVAWLTDREVDDVDENNDRVIELMDDFPMWILNPD